MLVSILIRFRTLFKVDTRCHFLLVLFSLARGITGIPRLKRETCVITFFARCFYVHTSVRHVSLISVWTGRPNPNFIKVEIDHCNLTINVLRKLLRAFIIPNTGNDFNTTVNNISNRRHRHRVYGLLKKNQMSK